RTRPNEASNHQLLDTSTTATQTVNLPHESKTRWLLRRRTRRRRRCWCWELLSSRFLRFHINCSAMSFFPGLDSMTVFHWTENPEFGSRFWEDCVEVVVVGQV